MAAKQTFRIAFQFSNENYAKTAVQRSYKYLIRISIYK